eukprot:1180703-Prorocentrum_minimum.AAC.3
MAVPSEPYPTPHRAPSQVRLWSGYRITSSSGPSWGGPRRFWTIWPSGRPPSQCAPSLGCESVTEFPRVAEVGLPEAATPCTCRVLMPRISRSDAAACASPPSAEGSVVRRTVRAWTVEPIPRK